MPICEECGKYTSWIYPVDYSIGEIKYMCKSCFNNHYRDKIDRDIEKYNDVPIINDRGEIIEVKGGDKSDS